jgi:hypothetical protein
VSLLNRPQPQFTPVWFLCAAPALFCSAKGRRGREGREWVISGRHSGALTHARGRERVAALIAKCTRRACFGWVVFRGPWPAAPLCWRCQCCVALAVERFSSRSNTPAYRRAQWSAHRGSSAAPGELYDFRLKTSLGPSRHAVEIGARRPLCWRKRWAQRLSNVSCCEWGVATGRGPWQRNYF